MTPEQQRIKIAEAFPKVIRANIKDSGYWTENPKWEYYDGETWNQCFKNDPLQDINTMHEAFSSLGLIQQIEWHHHLRNIVKRRCAENIDNESIAMIAVNATAKQRAEAFLRTLNLLEE